MEVKENRVKEEVTDGEKDYSMFVLSDYRRRED